MSGVENKTPLTEIMAKPAAMVELKTLGELNNWFSCKSLPRPTTERRQTGDGPAHAPVWEVKYAECKWRHVTPAVAPVLGPSTKQLKNDLSKVLIAMVNRGDWWICHTRPSFPSLVLWNEPPQECEIATDFGTVVKLRRMARDDSKEGSFDDEVYALIDRNMGGVIGFDCERDAKTNRTTLIQLADASVVLLYQPPLLSQELPKALAQLLRNPSVSKMVVDKSQDLKYLKADFKVSCDGMEDLQERALEFGFFKANTKVLADYFLRYDMTKEKGTAMTYSEASLTMRLSAAQIKYGALDAIVAYELGMKLLSIHATDSRASWSRCVYFGELPTGAKTNKRKFPPAADACYTQGPKISTRTLSTLQDLYAVLPATHKDPRSLRSVVSAPAADA